MLFNFLPGSDTASPFRLRVKLPALPPLPLSAVIGQRSETANVGWKLSLTPAAPGVIEEQRNMTLYSL